MGHLYIITGASSGIGEALANLLLKQGNCQVLGISRSNTISHAAYEHIHVDLSISLSNFFFDSLKKHLDNHNNILLVNNAGTVTPIGTIGSLDQNQIEKAFFLNTITPAVISNFVINHTLNSKKNLKILNIGTGASNRPIEGWSTYCASKAALKMLTETWKEESLQNHWGIDVQEFLPGVIDTPMQAEIRNASNEQFRNVDKFIKFKTENTLESPLATAEKIFKILN